jgi:hypothetical protein
MTDYRLPENRRETFLKFYEFHLKYRSHPGAVYYLIPYLRQTYNWSTDQTLWFTFLNGNTQNPTTSLIILKNFPDPKNLEGLDNWFNTNFERLKFDHDRRYQKKDFLKSVEWFVQVKENGGHQKFWEDLSAQGFTSVWKAAKNIPSFGRLSTFSFLEYQRVAGLPVDCDTLFLRDVGGSKSHRNGLCKLLGHDELDWHSSNPSFNGKYHQATLDWLEKEGETLISEAKHRFKGRDFERDVTYFTLESTLCTFKSWFRPNRRYPNVYNDMLYLRIKENEKLWPEQDFSVFWEARQLVLPKNLRLEDNPYDPGLSKLKQNWFREHGEVIMMDKDFPEFANSFNYSVDNGLLPLRKNK